MFNYQTVIIEGEKSMKKILLPLIFLILLPLVSACSNPVIYNSDDVPISFYGSGYLIIDGNDYTEEGWIQYPIKIKNTNTGQNLTFVIEPSTSISSIAKTKSFNLTADETQNSFIEFYISGSTKSGELYLTGSCGDGLPIPEGSVFTTINGKGTGGECLNTMTSCGTYPDCKNLYDDEFPECVEGYKQYYRCENNEPIVYRTLCWSSCCKEYLGEEAYCDGGYYDGICKTDANHAPTIDSYSPDSIVSSNEGADIEFTHTSSDLDNNTLAFSWLLNGTEKSSAQNWTYSSDTEGVYNVTLAVSDGDLSDSQEWELTINLLLSNGESCSSNEECGSNKCVHSVCRESDPYCGDDYCDDGEDCSSCSSDCGECSSSGGNSGGSSGGGSSYYSGGGSSTSGPLETTGFYDFPSTVEIDANSSKTIEGYFLSKYQSSLNNVDFKITGLNNNWFSIQPLSVNEIGYKETVDLKIIFTIPEDVIDKSYAIKLKATSGTNEFEQSLTLKIKEIEIVTTTTTILDQTTTTTLQGKPYTGAFVNVQSWMASNWYLLAVPIIVIGLAFLLPKINLSRIFTKDDANPQTYMAEPIQASTSNFEAKEPEKPEEKPVKKTKNDKAKNKVIEEIRKKAMDMDKKSKP